MGMFERMREPKAEGIEPAVWVASTILPSLVLVIGVSSTSRRNCVLFILGKAIGGAVLRFLQVSRR